MLWHRVGWSTKHQPRAWHRAGSCPPYHSPAWWTCSPIFHRRRWQLGEVTLQATWATVQRSNVELLSLLITGSLLLTDFVQGSWYKGLSGQREWETYLSKSTLQGVWAAAGITASPSSLFLFLFCQNVTLRQTISVALWTTGTPTWTGLLEEEMFGSPTLSSHRITPSRLNWVSWGHLFPG